MRQARNRKIYMGMAGALVMIAALISITAAAVRQAQTGLTVSAPTITLEAGAQAGNASDQSALQAAQETASAVSAGAGFRYNGGGVTTSFAATSSTGLVVACGGRPWREELAQAAQPVERGPASGPVAQTGDDARVFWWALAIFVCTAGIFLLVNILRGKRAYPHEKKHF